MWGAVRRTDFARSPIYAEFLNTLDVVGFVELVRYRQDCRNERLEAFGVRDAGVCFQRRALVTPTVVAQSSTPIQLIGA